MVISKYFRSVIALASKNGLKVHQMDVATDIFNGDLKEVVLNGTAKRICSQKSTTLGLETIPNMLISSIAFIFLLEFRFNSFNVAKEFEAIK